MALSDRIRSTFTTRRITFESPLIEPYEVQGITVRELKDRLRGVVYQSQPKFVEQIGAIGFKLTWSMAYNALIVHE
jgi:hypothetical protein